MNPEAKRTPELEQLLIDAEADDDGVQHSHPLVSRPWLLLLGLVLVALNLRPALSSLSPLLSEVSSSLGLSAARAGLLTTLPVLCLGLFAPLAPILARRFSAERVVLGILLTLAAGILLRSAFGEVGLFAGSLIAGASIGIIGVLLPGIVKRDFAKQAGTMTGVYTMALCLGAALAAGATVPLSDYFGNRWNIGLGFWMLPALLAALCWLPQVGHKHGAHRVAYQVKGLLRDPLAWQVTLYMGLQSSLAYIVFGWVPSILIDRGLSATDAGLALSGSIIVQLLSALTAPWLATRGKDQRLAIVVVMLLTLGGLMGCLYAPLDGLWGWAILLGPGLRLHPGVLGAARGGPDSRLDRRLGRHGLGLRGDRPGRHRRRPRCGAGEVRRRQQRENLEIHHLQGRRTVHDDIGAQVQVLFGVDHRLQGQRAAQVLDRRGAGGAACGVSEAQQALGADVDRVAVGRAPGQATGGGFGAVDLGHGIHRGLLWIERQRVHADLVRAVVEAQPVINLAVDVGRAVAVVAHAQRITHRTVADHRQAQGLEGQPRARREVEVLLGDLAEVH